MNPIIYNLALLIGVVLIGAGVGLTSIPHALIIVGALVLALNIVTALLVTRKR